MLFLQILFLVFLTIHGYPQINYDDSDLEDSTIAAFEDKTGASSQHTRAVSYPDNYPYQNSLPVRPNNNNNNNKYNYPIENIAQVVRTKSNYPQQFRPVQDPQQKDKLEEQKEEEEIEEPDRLSLLLPQSKFHCTDKTTGYYADEDLNCEVFHYCQDNVKHSWICPDGFTFHQVHLICMPPSTDNICAKSSQYHFVNDYLYKPINLEEHQQRPNVSLRYSERYYPDNIYQEDDYEDDERQINHHRTSVRVRDPEPEQITRTTFRPETTVGQVFRTPNEINIPLQQRRPQYVNQRYLV